MSTNQRLPGLEASQSDHTPQNPGQPRDAARSDPLWPDFDACTYQALGLSSNWLMELDLQYPFQEPLSLENLGEANARPRTEMLSHQDSSPGVTSNAQPTNNGHVSELSGSRPQPIHPSTSSSSAPKSLLSTYYRLSGPGTVLGIADEAFVDYYFENVCGIYSCFDSAANPFRYLVEKQWTNSAATYLTIQSMAIGHLSNYYPYLAPLGLQKRSQAWEYLQRDLRSTRINTKSDHVLLMNLLLLGMSSAWHQSSNLGMQYILIARELMQRRLQDLHPARGSQTLEPGLDDDFLEQSLLYWEMLVSWIDPVPLAPLYARLDLPSPNVPNISKSIRPHSWTGVVSEVQFALAEIGRVVRRQQSYRPSLNMGHNASGSSEPANRAWAASLETFLHAIELPSEEHIMDYNDLKTTKLDLITVADAYRCIGLLEVYRLYPELLRSRLEEAGSSVLDRLSLVADFNELDFTNTHRGRLCVLASHVLELIKPIVITSGACRLLPLVLLVAGSHLRSFEDVTSTRTASREEIISARYLVEARLLVLSRKYPQKPLLQMMDIVKEVWSRLDNGDGDAHFMEVVHELNWQTIMG